MGNTSKELKEIKNRAEKVKKVKDTRYHIAKYEQGTTAPSGWLYRARKRSSITAARIEELLAAGEQQMKHESRYLPFYAEYFVYPGPAPDKKWGPVCP